MINNNKILTVSYGTFSCTLEGFDDSFGTMKAIAEYFRDLSADDRYFGAEPAQPDARMLARIAEREISRHVEAREDKGRIVLSAQGAPQEAAALVASDAVADVADAIAEAAVAKADADQAASDEAPAPQEARATPEQISSPEPTEQEASDSVESPAPAAQPLVTEPEAEAGPIVEELGAGEIAPSDIVPSLPDEDVEAFFAEKQSNTFPDDAIHDEMEEVGDPANDRAKADSIADKLKRIRAVVSQQGEMTAAPDYSEDEHAEATVTPASNIADAMAGGDDDDAENTASGEVLASTLRDLEDALDADDGLEAARDEQNYDLDAESEDDDITAILSRLEDEAASDDDFDEEDEAIEAFSDAADEEDDDDAMDGNILAAMDTVGAATDESDLTDKNLFGNDDEAENDEDEGNFEPEVEKEASTSVTAKPAPVPPRTRVLKVKRTTLEAAILSGQLEEYDEDEAEEASRDSGDTAPLAERSSLSEEAEAALARELAELEADMEAGGDGKADTFEDADDFDDDYAEVDAAEDAPAVSPRISASADEDFTRLMEESEQQMEEPEAATRRDAFAHLRAAVAAKKADEAVGGTDPSAETDEAYRNDLANVVRPRRPSSSEGARTERPAEARPAPLKLVAEQRIDTGKPAVVTPVRPRRVAAINSVNDENAAAEESGFSDFAEEMGATKLPELLEAAAAYLSFIEGHENFSRPQLMTKVRQVEKENFTREDSLRSFGKLLREGKIEKMRGGRFQASDQIGFKPPKRAAG